MANGNPFDNLTDEERSKYSSRLSEIKSEALEIQEGIQNLPDNEVTSSPATGEGGQVPGTGGDEITTSADPTTDSDAERAQYEAGQELGGDTEDDGEGEERGLDWYAQQMREDAEQERKSARERYNRRKEAIGMEYDSELAQTNFEYKNAIEDLENNRKNAVGAAKSDAAALNPYSQARGARTADNFIGAINNSFQKKEQRLRQEARLAENALRAGEQKAYEQARANMETTIQQANEEAFNAILDLRSQERQEERFQQREERFERESRQQKNAQLRDDFTSALAEPLPSAEEIEDMTDAELLETLSAAQIGSQVYGMDAVREAVKAAAAEQDKKEQEGELDRDYRQARTEYIREQTKQMRESDDGETPAEERFTTTQINKGSTLSGLGEEEFKKLHSDVQSFYINISRSDAEMLAGSIKKVSSGEQSVQRFKETFRQAIPYAGSNVKSYFFSKVDQIAPSDAERAAGTEDEGWTWGGAWDSVIDTLSFWN